jgi:predicted secreted protein
MAALVGRKVTFTPTSGGVPVIGVRTKTITLNNEAIDITSDDDNGFRTLLNDDPAERSIDFTAEGISLSSVAYRIANGNPPLSQLATIIAAFLQQGGAKVSAEEVYAEIMNGEAGTIRELAEAVLLATFPQQGKLEARPK